MTLSCFEQGMAEYDSGNYVKAVRLFQQASAQFPNDAAILSKLGNALKRSGRFEEATEIHRQLVEKFPNAPEALSDLAAALLSWGKVEEAVHYFEKAVALCPSSAELHYNAAVANQRADNMQQATWCYRRAVGLSPDHASAWSNLGICLKAIGQVDEALQCQRRAISIDPSNPDFQWNLALTELLLGDFKNGFSRYEWRRRIPGYASLGGVPWTGEAARDKTLTVFAEQGIGDTFQFVRYLNAAKEKVGRLCFMCRKELIPFMRTGCIGFDEIIPFTPIDCDELSAPLMSLPHLLGLLDPLTSTVPYLHANPLRVEYWKPLLRTDTAVNVGFAWQGNPSHRDDHHRSISVSELSSILQIEEARFFSLQKRHGHTELDAMPTELNVVNLSGVLDDDGAFVDTAAVMRCMDIVLTVDTSIAHLAGGLGVETWTMLPFAPDFRWGQGECRFYPDMKLFRQESRGDWSTVIQAIRRSLIDRCRSTMRSV
jgi:Flp pilus assembly protein TadD